MSALGDRDAAARKNAPIARGVLWYFPSAARKLFRHRRCCFGIEPRMSAETIPELVSMLGYSRGVPSGFAKTNLEGVAYSLLRHALADLIAETGSFWAALAAVAEVSRMGNEQHNKGQPMHWARGKSTDHADCIVRHYADRGTVDTDGGLHSAKVLWRALALLETILDPRPEDGQPWSPVAGSQGVQGPTLNGPVQVPLKQIGIDGFASEANAQARSAP